MVLNRISYETLKKAAIYGAVLSVSGCSVLYYLLQRSMAMSPYYTKSLSALKESRTAMDMLGEPLRIQALKLNDKRNRIDNKTAKVLIPVSGTRSAGLLYSEATHTDGQWILDYVILEFKGRKDQLVILDKEAVTPTTDCNHVANNN